MLMMLSISGGHRNFPAWGKTCCLNCAIGWWRTLCARLRFLSGGVGFYGRDKSALDGSLVSSKHTPISGLKQAHSNVWFQASTLQSLVSSKHSTLQANCLFHISANVLPFCNAQALHAAESKHPAKFYEQSEMKIN